MRQKTPKRSTPASAEAAPEPPRKVSAARAEQLFEQLIGRRSPLTARAYRFDMDAFADFSEIPAPKGTIALDADAQRQKRGGQALGALLSLGALEARRLVERYERALIDRSRSLATVRRRIAAIQSVIREARREEVIDWSISVELTRNLSLDQKRDLGQRDMSGPTSEQYDQIRKVLDADGTLAGRRDRAILGLLHNPALRASEVAALRIKDVNLQSHRVKFIGKGREKEEDLPIPPSVARDIRAWLDLRGGSRPQPLFVQIQRYQRVRRGGQSRVIAGQWLTDKKLSYSAIYALCVQRGSTGGLEGKRLRPHGLRHLGATELVNHCAAQKIPLNEAQKVLRHKKAETTERYLDSVGRHARSLVEGIDR